MSEDNKLHPVPEASATKGLVGLVLLAVLSVSGALALCYGALWLLGS